MKVTYYIKDKQGRLHKTTSKIEANNMAYWNGTYYTVSLASRGAVERITPTRLILTNLIDQGFHNHQISK